MSKELRLDELLHAVDYEASFLRFAKALLADKVDEDEKEKVNPSDPYSAGCNGWQNSGIAQFLDAAIAFAKDTDFGITFRKSSNPWMKFAVFLYGGKIYE